MHVSIGLTTLLGLLRYLPSLFLSPHLLSLPPRLCGAIDRPRAEALLRGHGMHNGVFLVRVKLLLRQRVVFVLSVVLNNSFRHILLERRVDQPFTIDTGACDLGSI